jgi:excinuclease UvrABC ATPase subunit
VTLNKKAGFPAPKNMLKISETEKRLFSFNGKASQTYSATCEGCGARIEVSAAAQEDSEYDVLIFIRCQKCGTPVGMFVAA